MFPKLRRWQSVAWDSLPKAKPNPPTIHFFALPLTAGTAYKISASGFVPAGLASWRATFAPHTGNSKPPCPPRLAVVPYGFPYGHRLGCPASSLCWAIGILRWMAHSTASAVQNGPVLNSSCPYWNGPPEKFNCGVEKHLQTRYDPLQGQ